MLKCIRLVLLLCPLWVSSQSPVSPVRLDSISSSQISELKGRLGMTSWKFKVDSGTLLEVRARVVLPEGEKVTLPMKDCCVVSWIQAAGSRRTTWKTAASFVALQSKGQCSYIDPARVLQGAASMGAYTGGEVEVARATEGAPATLTVGPGTTSMCFAFVLATAPTGQVKLNVGAAQGTLPAKSKR